MTPGPGACPSCGAPLAEMGLSGTLCERCLVRLALDAPDEPPPPLGRIGPYRLVEKIAEGGMGVVWKAEQEEPVRRTVALKLIRPGLDSSEILARFDAERQALALMDHPGIARIHDAGATDDGRPYFVMEYFEGEPVTEYSDRLRLPLRERIAVFLEICDAVQHAHHKGVVHRDLKPSNVLVAEREGRPVIKVIDFGIAKATQIRLTDRTIETRIGFALGTPEYMSPEQASGSGNDVDTRTDVYSLGVLLYELAVGARPIDAAEMRNAAIDAILRAIREVDPPRPSDWLRTLGPAARDPASLRRADPRTLERELRGDLDWIATRALEKDRDRRYGSPAEFAADLRRHLRHEPVLAGPPSAAYRARKFARRHRLGVAVSGAVGAALVVGIVGTTWGLVRATRAEREAREHAATAERVSDFLVGLFEVSDPSESRGRTITAREVLDRGAERIESELADEPAIRARILGTLGKVYTGIGLTADGIRFLEAAWEHDRNAPRLPDSSLANGLAWAYITAGRYDDAERVYLEAIDRSRADAVPRVLSMATAGLGNLRRIQGRYDESERLLDEGTVLCERWLGPEHFQTMAAHVNLAATYLNLERFVEATKVMERITPVVLRVKGRDDPVTLVVLRVLGNCYWKTRRYDDAIATMEQVLADQVRVVGPRHPAIQESLGDLALVHEEAGQLDAAERRYREAVTVDRAGENNQREAYYGSLNGLARLLCRRGACAEAEALLRSGLDGVSDSMRRHPRVGETRIELARVLRADGKERDARIPLLANLDLLRDGEGEWIAGVRAQSHALLARIEARAGDRESALRELRAAVREGYRDGRLATDPDFSALSGDAELAAIVAEAAPQNE